MRGSVSPEHFEAKYRADPDPWHYASSPYEAAKYQATLDALPRARYRRALEIGCSIGVLTARLGRRCDELVALDVSETALRQARERCVALPQVRFARMQVPDELPEGRFDLVLLSEVGYYLARDDLLRLRERLVARLLPGGQLVLVHWTPAIDDAPLTGDAVHAVFVGMPDQLAWLAGRREQSWRLDVLERR